MADIDDDPDERDSDDGPLRGGDFSATRPCPRCRRPVFEDAEQCPRCGWYITDADYERPGKPWWLWLGAALALAASLAWLIL